MRIKVRKNFRNRSRGLPLLGDSLPKSGNFWYFWSRVPTRREPIGVKIRVAKRTQVPLGRTKFHMNRCNESPMRGENADFGPVSKFKYRLVPFRGILLVNNNRNKKILYFQHEGTAGFVVLVARWFRGRAIGLFFRTSQLSVPSQTLMLPRLPEKLDQ